jgi:hypothetical protein
MQATSHRQIKRSIPPVNSYIAGIVHQPHEAWMKQQARKLTDVFDGFRRGKWKLIHDRDPLSSAGFTATLGKT